MVWMRKNSEAIMAVIAIAAIVFAIGTKDASLGYVTAKVEQHDNMLRNIPYRVGKLEEAVIQLIKTNNKILQKVSDEDSRQISPIIIGGLASERNQELRRLGKNLPDS